VLRIPYNLLSVMIIVFCFVGTYSINNNMVDVVMTFAFGIIGLIFNKYGFERPPLILAFVLGPLVEKAFRQSMIFSDGGFTIFFIRPISAFFILITAGVLIAAFIKKRSFARKIEAEQ
jgi:TctA family transporter